MLNIFWKLNINWKKSEKISIFSIAVYCPRRSRCGRRVDRYSGGSSSLMLYSIICMRNEALAHPQLNYNAFFIMHFNVSTFFDAGHIVWVDAGYTFKQFNYFTTTSTQIVCNQLHQETKNTNRCDISVAKYAYAEILSLTRILHFLQYASLCKPLLFFRLLRGRIVLNSSILR